MIERRLTFVLGAGASYPFGYPTGNQLRVKILQELRFRDGAVRTLLASGGHDSGTLLHFAQAFERSSFGSIDRFLASRDLPKIGTEVLAAVLLHAELSVRIWSEDADRVGDTNWYGYLWNRLTAGVDDPFDLERTGLRFVTFNYDASLERFLFHSLQAGYNLDASTALRIAKAIPIHHVYGCLAQTDEERFCSLYQAVPGPDTLVRVAKGIRVVPSQRPEADETAFKYLGDATTIVFLGFGFDPMNCARLGIARLQENLRKAKRGLPAIVGTALNMTSAEQALAREAVDPGDGGRIMLSQVDSLTLLRDNVTMLR